LLALERFRDAKAHGNGLDFPVALRQRLERERLDDAVGPDTPNKR
jgi:hypothetical protein